ncbi:hypothetical protein BDU57DRAFT_511845 [Ampelomyces quisqualis]|uniref:Uncharacterized protein n=1 Tax=Ampelomyces quisqualis TaxID=50730 RepID=A0A6A5QUD6_AMPQU|nr:hypothetical protein BDU57DRAFT_511845 [Ampelomyces quisqualis]
MPCTRDIPAMLSVTAAAIDLGMDKYVAHMYRKCEAVLRNHFPAYAALDALASLATQHARLLYVVASQNLAVRMRANRIPDPEAFEAYLRTRNTVLGEHIRVAMERFQGYVRVNERMGEELVERVERAKKNQVAARIAGEEEWEEEEEEKRKRIEEKEVADQVFWMMKKAEEEYDEKSVQQKLELEEGDAGRKFTARDRAHWRKTRGTRLPAWAE